MIFAQLTQDLPEPPAYRKAVIRDKNPLAGTCRKRELAVPNLGLMVIHWRLNSLLRQLSYPQEAVTGSRPGFNPYRNVLPHRHHRFLYLLDIKGAYGQVRTDRLTYWLAQYLGAIDEEETEVVEKTRQFLVDYCLLENGGLLTGTPASPDLFNFYAAHEIDLELLLIAEKYQLTYTRYLDDLTFSAATPIGKKKRQEIRAVLERALLPINHRKSQVLDLKKGAAVITGIGLAYGGRIFLPHSYLAKLDGMLFAAMMERCVPAAKVHGMMGVFWLVYRDQLKDFDQLTKLERKIIHRWSSWRHFRGFCERLGLRWGGDWLGSAPLFLLVLVLLHLAIWLARQIFKNFIEP